jgi:hypothetical protein
MRDIRSATATVVLGHCGTLSNLDGSLVRCCRGSGAHSIWELKYKESINEYIWGLPGYLCDDSYLSLICFAMVKKACSTFDEFLALVSKMGI